MPPLVVDVPPLVVDVPPTTIAVPVPPAGVTFLLFREGDEVADSDGGAETAGVGLAEAAADVALSLDVADWLPQSVLVVLGSGVLLPAGLEVASSVALSVALAVVVLLAVVAGLLVADGLTVLLGLSVGSPLPVDGLVGGLVGGVDGLIGGCDGVIVGLAEPVPSAGEGDTDDGEHDAGGVDPFCSAGVVPAAPGAPVPLPKAVPAPPGLAELAGLAAWWPSRAPDTDERNGGTAARTTPTAKTAKPIAIAGLSSASRQSLVWRGARRA